MIQTVARKTSLPRHVLSFLVISLSLSISLFLMQEFSMKSYIFRIAAACWSTPRMEYFYYWMNVPRSRIYLLLKIIFYDSKSAASARLNAEIECVYGKNQFSLRMQFECLKREENQRRRCSKFDSHNCTMSDIYCGNYVLAGARLWAHFTSILLKCARFWLRSANI